MKKIRNFAILLAVVLVAGVTIFYACTKENDVVNDAVNNLKKEAQFVAKIHEKMCVQVDVFRDEENNVHITTQKVATDPTIPIGIIVPDALKIEPQQAKNDDGIMIEIPNDAIYWLVPLDGNEPVKFEPVVSDAKVSNGDLKASCTCTQGKTNCLHLGLTCPPPMTYSDKYGTWYTCPAPNGNVSCCQTCVLKYSVGLSSASSLIMTSSYIVQSNSITVNGLFYQ